MSYGSAARRIDEASPDRPADDANFASEIAETSTQAWIPSSTEPKRFGPLLIIIVGLLATLAWVGILCWGLVHLTGLL
jgi:hypothetical protein